MYSSFRCNDVIVKFQIIIIISFRYNDVIVKFQICYCDTNFGEVNGKKKVPERHFSFLRFISILSRI